MRFALLSALALLVFAGCDSGGGDGNSALCTSAGITSTGSLTATVGGDGFESVCVRSQFDDGVLGLGAISNLGEAGASQRQVNLVIPRAAVGTVSLNATGTGGIATYSSLDISNPTDASGLYTALSGTAEITALSATGAAGTFSFTGRNNAGGQIEISRGRFDIEF